MSNGVERASEMNKVLKQMIKGERYHVGVQTTCSETIRKPMKKAMNIGACSKNSQEAKISKRSKGLRRYWSPGSIGHFWPL